MFMMRDGSFFYLAPDNYNNFSSINNLYLFRRGDKVFDYENNNAYSGYISTIDKFCPATVILASNMKVGIAFREINGERFALVVYDVTITTATPDLYPCRERAGSSLNRNKNRTPAPFGHHAQKRCRGLCDGAMGGGSLPPALPCGHLLGRGEYRPARPFPAGRCGGRGR